MPEAPASLTIAQLVEQRKLALQGQTLSLPPPQPGPGPAVFPSAFAEPEPGSLAAQLEQSLKEAAAKIVLTPAVPTFLPPEATPALEQTKLEVAGAPQPAPENKKRGRPKGGKKAATLAEAEKLLDEANGEAPSATPASSPATVVELKPASSLEAAAWKPIDPQDAADFALGPQDDTAFALGRAFRLLKDVCAGLEELGVTVEIGSIRFS